MSGSFVIGKTTLALIAIALLGIAAIAAFMLQANTPISNAGQPLPDSAQGAGPAGGDSEARQGGAAPDYSDADAAVQDIYIRALSTYSYDTEEITVKKGIPVRLHFSADDGAGCGRAFYIYGLGVKAVSRGGEEQVVDFTPDAAGTYEYNCGMRMFSPGRLVVV